MLKVVALCSVLVACAHPRTAIVSGATMVGLGVLGLSAHDNSMSSSCGGDGGCVAGSVISGVGDSLAVSAEHTGGALMLTAGIAVLGAGLIGLSNEHAHVQAEHHRM